MPTKKNKKPEKALMGIRNRRRGHSYETKIAKELRELTGDEEIKTSRSESKSLDDKKIDIFDGNDTLPFYCQLKATQQMPQVKKLMEEVGKKDKPLVIFWNAQEAKEKKQVSVGEYCILPKDFFYSLLTCYYASKL